MATLKSPDERILVPGFYDRVRPPSAAELRAVELIPDDDAALLADFAIPEFLGGLRGVERRKANLFNPTCTICGLVAGYTGEGSKTVLPSEARAKIDFRMVPDQDPDAIVRNLHAPGRQWIQRYRNRRAGPRARRSHRPRCAGGTRNGQCDPYDLSAGAGDLPVHGKPIKGVW